MVKYILTACGLFFISSSLLAQTTFHISPATTIVNNASVQMPAGSFVNDGSYNDNAGGTFNVWGGVTFGGAGTTTFYDMTFPGAGASFFSSLVSVFNNTNIGASAAVDANNNLWVRSDLNPGAAIVVEGVLSNPVQGIVATATATTGCPDYTSMLAVNITGSVVVYQWQSSPDNSTWTNIPGGTTNPYLATVSATAYYRCVVTTTNSSFTNTTGSLYLEMYRAPVVITAGNRLCEGGAAVPVTASGAPSFTWSPATGLSATTGAIVYANPAVTSTYTVTATSVMGCTGMGTVTVTVDPTPAAITGQMLLCNGGSSVLSDAIAGGTWSSSNMAVATIGSGTGVVTTVSAGSATVTYTMPCGSFVTADLTINPTPTAAPTNDGPICVTGTVNLAANPAGGATIYSWSGPDLLSATLPNPAATPTATATYSLMVSSGTEPGCSPATVYTTSVTVYSQPVLAPTNDGPICNSGTVNLMANASGGVGAYFYTWFGPALSSTSVANPTAMPTAPVTYSVSVSNLASGCNSGILYATTVSVSPRPTASPANDGAICTGGTVNLTSGAADGTGVYMYSWAGPALASTTAANPSATPTATATYSVTVSNAASGCVSDVFTTTVSVQPKPMASPANDGPICPDGTANLMANATGGVGAYQYTWTGANLSSTTLANPSATPTVTGTYSVTVSNTASGCNPGIAYTTMVTVNAKPTAAPANDGPICRGSVVHLTANAAGGAGAYSYNWSGPGLSAPFVANPTATPGVNSVYSLTVSSAAPGCSSGIVYTTSVQVDTINSPSVSITGHSSIKAGQRDTLTAVVTNGGPGVTYQWMVNATFIAGATSSVYISNTLANHDTVRCIVTSHGPCGSVTSAGQIVITITNLGVNNTANVIGDVSLVPNPNNGHFTLDAGIGVPDNEDVVISITNMLGQRVYEEHVAARDGLLHQSIAMDGSIANGVYLLNISTGGSSKVLRFVVAK